MIPESIRAEIESHGGLAATEGPDANGITTYRAADGLFVNIGQDGRPRMRGYGPPSDAQQQPATTPSAAAPTRGGQTVALDPNEVVTQGVWEKPDDVEGALQNIKIPDGIDKTQWGTKFYAQWTIYKDGRRVIQWYERNTGDGKNDPVKARTEDKIPKIEDKWKEDAAKEAKPDQVVTINGVPSHVTGKDANGQDIWGPVQTATGPATANAPTAQKATKVQVEGTPDGQGGFDNTRPVMASHWPDGRVTYEPLTEPERLRWEKEKNGGKTDAEIRTEATTTPKEEVNPSDPTRLRKPDGRGGWTDAGPNAAGVQAAADRNKPKPEPDGKGGYGYWDTSKTPPVWTPINGGPTATQTPVEVNGQYGVWKPGVNGGPPTFEPIQNAPAPGTASAGGPQTPRMPNFILDASIKGLTDFVTATHADPSLTPAQKDKRIQEAIQLANIAVAQWATEQNERESQRNTDYNVGTYSAKFLQDGQQAAFKFASELKGTDLGGKVFAAMLGLNLATLEASNLARLTGKPAPPAPIITPADMRSTTAIDAKRAEIDQHLATVTQPNAIGAGAIGMPGAPAPPPPSVPSPAAVPRPATPGPVVGPQVAPSGPPAVGVNPDAGQALGPTGDSPPLPAAPGIPQVSPDMSVQQTPPAAPDTAPIFEPGPHPYTPPPSPLPAGEVTMTPPTDFAALSQFQAPPPMPMQQPAAGGGDMVALRLAEIASKPSWLMSEDEFNFAKQHGQEQAFWQTPGAAA